MFPDLISRVVQDIACCLGNALVAPKVKLDIKLLGTWLAHPAPKVRSDLVGVWPESTLFPTCDKNYSAPGKAASTMPPKVPYELINDDIGKFLEGKFLLNNGKVRLNSQAFEPREVSVDKSSNFYVVDSLSMKCLIENTIVDQFIETIISHLDTLFTEWDSYNVNDLKGQFMMLYNALKVAWAANGRGKQLLIALFTSNKIAFRKHVLGLCGGSNQSKETLTSTTLASPSLFGDIPESFACKLDANSHTYNSYVLHPRGCLSRGFWWWWFWL